jgi:hypothetical protein
MSSSQARGEVVPLAAATNDRINKAIRRARYSRATKAA